MPRLSDIAYYEDPYGLDYADNPSGFKQTKKFLSDVGRGVSYAPQDLLGAPVDLINLPLQGINWATGKKIFSEKPVGGSDWLIEKSHKALPDIIPKPDNSGGELIGRIGAGAINPAGAVRGAIKATSKTADIAGDATLELMRRATGNPELSKQDVLAGAAEELVNRLEKGISGVPGTAIPLRANIIKPEGGNWLEEPAQLSNKYAPKQNWRDLYDEWVSNPANDLDDNFVQEAAWDKAFQRRSEIRTSLNDRETALVNKYEDARDNVELARSGEHPELNDGEWDLIKDDLAMQIGREMPHLSFEDRVALTFDPHNDFDPLGDANQYYKSIAADEIAKKTGIQSLSDFIASKNIANKWYGETVPTYLKKKFGTPSDPLRKAADEGRYTQKTNLSEQDMANEIANDKYVQDLREQNAPEFAKVNQAAPTKEGLAQTTQGKYHEAQTDRAIKPVLLKDLLLDDTFDKSKFKWVNETTPEDTTFYKLKNNPYLETTLKDISKEARALTDEGRITPENYKKWTVDQVAVEATNRRLAKEKLEGATREKIEEWAAARKETIPADRSYGDGAKMVVFSKANSSDNPDLLKRDLSLQTCILEHCVGSGGRNADNTQYLPMVSPATGEKTKGSSGTGIGYGYYKEILDGDAQIHSILNEKGLPEATMEFRLSSEGDDYNASTYTVDQIRGFDNGEVPKKYHKRIVDYLNETPYIEEVSDLDYIGAHEANADAMRDVLHRTLGGESDNKTERIIAKLAAQWNRNMRKQGSNYFVTKDNVLEEIVNNDMLNSDIRYILDAEEDKVYKKVIEDYLK